MRLGRGAAAILAALLATVGTAVADGPSISIGADGTLAIQGSAEIPRYAPAGQWVEVRGRSSERWLTRHFLFSAPSGPPAVELYVSHDRRGEPPDGAFEIGLVNGFLSGFAAKAGLRHGAPVFEEATINGARATRCRVELSGGDRRLWLYAYVFPRRPGLTFLTLRPRGDETGGIESYLMRVRLR